MRDFSLLFRQAWDFARNGVKAFGGRARDYLPESLRLAHAVQRRNVTAKDLVKIMFGRCMTIRQIREEVNARFKEQTAKNISRRIWNMFRSRYVEIEKIKCPETGSCIYILKKVDSNFYRISSVVRALRMEVKPKERWVKPPLPMSREEINVCRLANAFHKALTVGTYTAPQLV